VRISFRLPLTPLTDPQGILDVQDQCFPCEANAVDRKYWRFANVRVVLPNPLGNSLIKSSPLFSAFALLEVLTVG
jgi:hypothetical protein